MFKSKTILTALSLLIIVFSNFRIVLSQEASPQKVYRYCYVIKSNDWYSEQAKLWKTEASRNPLNENAWYNYFFAVRYASLGMEEKERTGLMNSILDEIGAAIPDSYLYPYLKYYNGERKIEHLEKAYKLKPDCSDLYWEFIMYYELKGMKQQKKEFCEKLYSSRDIISSLFDYNFNMLNSTEKNSILFTNGDNDNYPAWVLQEAKGVRRDVTILNVYTVFGLRDYLKLKLDEKGLDIDLDILPKKDVAVFLKELISSIRRKYPGVPIHVAPTVYEEPKKEIKDRLFTTGLVYTYSEEKIDNAAMIKKNLEQNLRLDYLERDWYNEQHVSQSLMDRYNLNYIPAFMELSKMYHASGAVEMAEYYREKAIFIARKADDKDLIKEIEEKYW